MDRRRVVRDAGIRERGLRMTSRPGTRLHQNIRGCRAASNYLGITYVPGNVLNYPSPGWESPGDNPPEKRRRPRHKGGRKLLVALNYRVSPALILLRRTTPHGRPTLPSAAHFYRNRPLFRSVRGTSFVPSTILFAASLTFRMCYDRVMDFPYLDTLIQSISR